MRIIDLQEADREGKIATIGVFDGVHIGHMRILERVVERGKTFGLIPTVITFKVHPEFVIKGKAPAVLTTFSQKARLFERAGIKLCLLLEFSRDISLMEPEEFIEKYIVQVLNIRYLVVGHDFAFGKGRSGTWETLKQASEKFGFGLERIEPVRVRNIPVSSTRIRELIAEGKLEAAREFLGRAYIIEGEVVGGEGRGRRLGFPTANIDYNNMQLPPDGVYAGFCKVEGEIHKAVANLGLRPTFGEGKRVFEVYILDFSDNIYGQKVEFAFVRRLREEIRFPSVHKLIEQMRLDILEASKMLKDKEVDF